MHWLTEFQQHVVGDVYNRVDGAYATTTQFFLQPQRTGA